MSDARRTLSIPLNELPDSVREWLMAQATEQGKSPAEVLEALLARAAEEDLHSAPAVQNTPQQEPPGIYRRQGRTRKKGKGTPGAEGAGSWKVSFYGVCRKDGCLRKADYTCTGASLAQATEEGFRLAGEDLLGPRLVSAVSLGPLE